MRPWCSAGPCWSNPWPRSSVAIPTWSADTAAASIAATASYPLLSAAGLVLGAVGFGWPSPQEFGSDQVRHLDLVANLAAQALERAVLSQRERERASTRERADAQLLQDAFLPRSLPRTDTLDVAAVYLPASDAAMGGDWYDVFPVAGGTCLVIGDVAGHGVQSAAVMGQLRNSVRAYATEDPSPASVLTRLNRMMCRLEPGEYATAIVAVWDEERGTLLRSNAGHPPVLRCRPGEFEFLTPPPGGRLLGVSPDWAYHEQPKVLRPGTTMLFYTDGLVERRGQELGDGMGALLSFVEVSTTFPPRRRAIRSCSGGAPRVTSRTTSACWRRGSGSPASRQPGRKSTNNRLTSSGASSCIQWPGPSSRS